MINVRLQNVVKQFGTTMAVDHVNVNVQEGEFFTFLGPSGCGKSTTLRIIAGFESPDSGEVYFDDRRMNEVPPEKRNTGMVFQNYAIWPHMTVFENVAFGLEMRKIPSDLQNTKVLEALSMVELEGLEKRIPDQLSGGQQQRVALARALVIEPDVLLLDEPLSNLDAKLRVEMRTEIRKLQKRVGITTIYVTHDQKEALAVSDRIAIMNQGKIEQIGTPTSIYEQPTNQFVADFIGLINLFSGTISEIKDKKIRITTDSGHEFTVNKLENIATGMTILIAVRPENMEVQPHSYKNSRQNLINGVIEGVEYQGDIVRYKVRANDITLNTDQYAPAGKKIFNLSDHVIVCFDREAVGLIETK
jgi:iron(III) transport system ATP-binding protein